MVHPRTFMFIYYFYFNFFDLSLKLLQNLKNYGIQLICIILLITRPHVTGSLYAYVQFIAHVRNEVINFYVILLKNL